MPLGRRGCQSILRLFAINPSGHLDLSTLVCEEKLYWKIKSQYLEEVVRSQVEKPSEECDLWNSHPTKRIYSV
ncbi:MAG: hypothetical protein F6K18_06785 [Okeania sp. SIO2C2]|uniref:hypothetical protein n=1 Tax=Okeania sp. SIO2C2 TaxID=2607787 RepID=UPI0013BB35DA|nr:hypothetical protein [Okeania sp. SIO2C2]NEP86554.1 hypothetical protein [Okeania sp. SIO2C2]